MDMKSQLEVNLAVLKEAYEHWHRDHRLASIELNSTTIRLIDGTTLLASLCSGYLGDNVVANVTATIWLPRT